MKNKEFIKKSIEENIVDHTAVLNNLRAKAAVLEAERASKHASRFGLKKAVVCTMAALVCIACVLSSIFLFQSDSGLPPIAAVNSVQEESTVQYNNTSSSPAAESSLSAQNPVDTSREPKSESACSEIVTETPLSDEEKAFFYDFTEKFTVLQNLINARLDADNEKDGYLRVQDADFQNINDIKDFLYSFMKPESAGEIFVGLTSGAMPYYMEKNGALYQKAQVKENGILTIHTDTAFLISKDENMLIINAMLQTDGEQDFFNRFVFEKINGEWLYAGVWRTADALSNNTNNK